MQGSIYYWIRNVLYSNVFSRSGCCVANRTKLPANIVAMYLTNLVGCFSHDGRAKPGRAALESPG